MMKQYISRARVFANRYVKDDYTGSDDLGKHVSKYEEKIRPVVAGAVCSILIERISLKNYSRLLKGLKSIKEYINGRYIGEIEKRVSGICKDYKLEKKEKFRDLKRGLETTLKDSWKAQGIWGSAVDVNINASPEWEIILDELDTKYNRLLNSVKGEFKS